MISRLEVEKDRRFRVDAPMARGLIFVSLVVIKSSNREGLSTGYNKVSLLLAILSRDDIDLRDGRVKSLRLVEA